MTDEEILNFCKEHDAEVSFSYEKKTGRYFVRMRKGFWQFLSVIMPVQISEKQYFGSVAKCVLDDMAEKIERERKNHNDSD